MSKDFQFIRAYALYSLYIEGKMILSYVLPVYKMALKWYTSNVDKVNKNK